jgi:hypothetical protein
VKLFRLGLAVIQGIMRLFGAGAVLYGAHMLFLRYYAREWAGIAYNISKSSPCQWFSLPVSQWASQHL